MIPKYQPVKNEHQHGGAVCRVQRHGYCQCSNILAVSPSWWVRWGRWWRILLDFVNRPREKLISKLINFMLFLYPLPTQLPRKHLYRPSPLSPPPIKSPLLFLLCHAHIFLVGCCVLIFYDGGLRPCCIFFLQFFLLLGLPPQTIVRHAPPHILPKLHLFYDIPPLPPLMPTFS